MRNITVDGEKYNMHFFVADDGAWLANADFGHIKTGKTTLFSMVVRDLENGTEETLTGDAGWGKVSTEEDADYLSLTYGNPENGADLSVTVTVALHESGAAFDVRVCNADARFSVLSAAYPIPSPTDETFDFFMAKGPGRLIRDFRHHPYNLSTTYPSIEYAMQYMAFFTEKGGLYVGHHDRTGAVKHYRVRSENGETDFAVIYPAENLGKGANSFLLRGGAVWERIDGDWYDAAMFYRKFACTADWIPVINRNGRPDTPERFSDVAFWIMDFLPNIAEQGDNMPESLRYGLTDDKDAWWKTPIRLAEALGVPVGYHVYNWHKNAFNIDYPHFLPAKDDFLAGVRRLHEKGILVAPYINAVSWESRDNAPSVSESFAVSGIHCAVRDEKGRIVKCVYPQIKPDGEKTLLVPICPTVPLWQKIMESLSRRIERETEIDGIYYDETAAHKTYACTNPAHPHQPGNGSYCYESVRSMMAKIRAGRPAGNFSFTEGNAEQFMNAFDGFLTWYWGDDGEVPAYPAIYSQYITLLGRTTGGKKKGDDFLCRYGLAASLVYGQQLGWINADIVDDPARFPFLKKCAELRYALRDVFRCGAMLRPPVTKCNLPRHETGPHLWFTDTVHMDAVLSGAWQDRDKAETHLIVANADVGAAEFKISFSLKEYGLSGVPAALSGYETAYDAANGRLTVHGKIDGCAVLHFCFACDKIAE